MLQQISNKHLVELKSCLAQINDVDYSRQLPVLDNGTLGKHVRHILEFYECLFAADKNGSVCYDKRKRNLQLEVSIRSAMDTIDAIIEKTITATVNKPLFLCAWYGTAEITMESSLYREITYNIEHTVHHLAIIRIAVCTELRYVSLPDTFGYADSTVQFHRSKPASA